MKIFKKLKEFIKKRNIDFAKIQQEQIIPYKMEKYNPKFDNDEYDYGHNVFWKPDNDNINEYGVNSYYNDPCENCMNNPKNNPNASGVCHCVLPAMRNIKF